MFSIRRSASGSISIIALPLFASISVAQVTARVSVDSSGGQTNSLSNPPSISADARYVAFSSYATNLVPGDTNGISDVFVRDRQLGTTERVSIDSSGAQANGDCGVTSISADGRYVAYECSASNLVPGDTNGVDDILVRDRQLGSTERVSVDSGAAQANLQSEAPAISADGRYVAFESMASNLVPGDTNGTWDIFVRDRLLGTTERVSVASSGAEANALSLDPSISADGRYVAFRSAASNLVPGDTTTFYDIFVRDRQLGTTQRVSLTSSGGEANSASLYSSISADGLHVAFGSNASNLVPFNVSGEDAIYVRNLQLGTTELVSLASDGVQANDPCRSPSISADGRYVTFVSKATNLIPGDSNLTWDVFVRDRQLGTTQCVSIALSGTPGNFASDYPAISADGRFVAFQSYATNLVPNDTNGAPDIFVRDRDATGFTSLCDPGVAGVIACPCSNLPSGPGRGCDNSSTTGGAILSASGIAYLSTDSLVFTTSAEKPTATSIVMQGNSLLASGLVFGQGVRCVGGTLKRLYTKTASGGSITAPQGGDLSVSARSSALGDVISAGQSRWYLVYYRDPIVLGGCPASSTFNATQTARIDWSL